MKSIEEYNRDYEHSLMGVLGMEILPAESGAARARMRVDWQVCQPFGLLSGGASLALAESLAGHGSRLLCAPDESPYGVQVSGNHLRAVPQGETVIATGRLLSHSRRVHVWNVDITDERERLVSTVRIVNYIKKTEDAHGATGMENHTDV